jgi:hypothetical protein
MMSAALAAANRKDRSRGIIARFAPPMKPPNVLETFERGSAGDMKHSVEALKKQTIKLAILSSDEPKMPEARCALNGRNSH